MLGVSTNFYSPSFGAKPRHFLNVRTINPNLLRAPRISANIDLFSQKEATLIKTHKYRFKDIFANQKGGTELP